MRGSVDLNAWHGVINSALPCQFSWRTRAAARALQHFLAEEQHHDLSCAYPCQPQLMWCLCELLEVLGPFMK